MNRLAKLRSYTKQMAHAGLFLVKKLVESNTFLNL